MMKRIRLAISLFLLVIIPVVAFYFRINTNKPPEAEVLEAARMLAEAELEKSAGYASHTFQEAKMYYDSAMVEWRTQNDRFILFRNYDKVLDFANKSMNTSENAIQKSRKTISDTHDLLEFRLKKVGDQIENIEDHFGNFPIDKKHSNEYIKCKMIYSEGLLAFKNRNYSHCKSKLDSAEKMIKNVSVHYHNEFKNYFGSYEHWNRMVEQTKNYSKKNQTYALIIDKMDRKLLVYKNGKVIKSYSVELGINWVGDKKQQGDKSTPEGMYKIIGKKQNGETRYYKALLLDYPNADDKKRFLLNKKNGTINKNARIGNLIEIHGNGGKGTDWTNGCIALEDSEMDEIFKICPLGTKVTIVGSAKSMNELSLMFK